MTPEKLNNLNTNEAPKQTDLVDNFPKTTKLLEKEELKDKKENILKVLEEWNLKEIFENLLSSEDGELCIMSLLTCENNEEEIKKVILENLPEWYAYSVSTNEIVKTKVKESDDYSPEATTTDTDYFSSAKTADNELKQSQNKKELFVQNNIDLRIVEEVKNILNEWLELRNELLKNHPDIAEKTRKDAEEFKKKLPEETKKQLEERGYDENIINNYILLRVTLNEIKWNPDFEVQITEFEDKVNWISKLDAFLKNIDNNCKIPDTYFSSFSEWNISETRKEIFNDKVWNEDLREEKKRNRKERNKKDSDWELVYDKMFPKIQSEEELIDVYWKFYQPKDWEKNLLEEYNNHRNNLNDLNEYKETKDYDKLLKKINKIKDEVEEKTKDLVDELCILSQIKWMYMCIWEWAEFNLNKAREIKSKNWVITLNGHIDWIDFALRQDTKDPEARLQTSTKMKKDEKNNRFSIWNNFKDSNFSLPSQNQIFNVAVESVKSDWALDRATTPWEYVKLIQERFMKRIDKKYEDTKYLHHYMKEQIKWEKIMDNTIKTVEKIKGSKLSSTVNNVGLNKKLYDFFSLIDFNVRNSSAAEKNKLDDIMNKVKDITSSSMDKPDNPEFNKYRPIIKDHLTGNALQNISENLNGHASDWKTMFDLFQLYKKPWDGELRMINFDYLYYDLFTPTNPDQPSIIEGSPVSLGYEEQKEIIGQDTADARLSETIERNIT